MVHVCYGYSKNIAEKRSTPVYASAVELLASTTVDDLSLEYEQPGHTPELLERTGDKGVALGVLDLDTEAPVETVEHIVGARRGRDLGDRFPSGSDSPRTPRHVVPATRPRHREDHRDGRCGPEPPHTTAESRSTLPR